MREWEDVKAKWDGSSTVYLRLDFNLLTVRDRPSDVCSSNALGGYEGTGLVLPGVCHSNQLCNTRLQAA